MLTLSLYLQNRDLFCPLASAKCLEMHRREEGWHDFETDFTHIDWKESHNSCHFENTWTERGS